MDLLSALTNNVLQQVPFAQHLFSNPIDLSGQQPVQPAYSRQAFSPALANQGGTPVFLRGRMDTGPQGQMRDAGQGNIWAFKEGTRLARPSSQPLTFGEQLIDEPKPVGAMTPSMLAEPPPIAYSQPAPVDHSNLLNFIIPTAHAGDWKDTLDPNEAWIIQHESGFNPNAQNPTSTAFGIWQGLAGTRQKYAAQVGVSPTTTDPNEQLAMMRAYVKDRYGTPANAKAFWERNHWY